jgi:hypothetical protein
MALEDFTISPMGVAYGGEPLMHPEVNIKTEFEEGSLTEAELELFIAQLRSAMEIAKVHYTDVSVR